MRKLINRIKKNEILSMSLEITGVVLYSILCATIIILIAIKIINNPSLLGILGIIILIFLLIFSCCVICDILFDED